MKKSKSIRWQITGAFLGFLVLALGLIIFLNMTFMEQYYLENKKEIVERIKQAAQYIPLDRLYLSPQCGFASCEIGNKLTEEEQWAKLKLVKEIAEEVWK